MMQILGKALKGLGLIILVGISIMAHHIIKLFRKERLPRYIQTRKDVYKESGGLFL